MKTGRTAGLIFFFSVLALACPAVYPQDALEDGLFPSETEISTADGDYKNSSGNLRFSKAGGDFFSVGRHSDSGFSFVDYDGKKMRRRTFDGLNRILKTEIFENSADSLNLVLAKEVLYSYRGKSKILSVQKEKDYSNDSETVYEYSASGLLSHFMKEERQSGETIRQSETEYSYDDFGRKTEETVLVFENDGLKMVQIVENKTVFKYKKDGQPPDSFFYDGGKLRMRTVYSAGDTYVQTAFFDNNITVRDVYENGIKVSSVVSSPFFRTGGSRR